MVGTHGLGRILRRAAQARLFHVVLLLTILLPTSGIPLVVQDAARAALLAPIVSTDPPRPAGWQAVASSEPVTVGRSAYTRTDQNPDGTYTTTVGVRPLHWHDSATGQWRPFDNALTATRDVPGVAYQNVTNGYHASFGGKSDVAAGKPVLQLTKRDAAIGLTAIGVNPSDVTVDGAEITYHNAYRGVDLHYVIDDERVKEELVLATLEAATAPRPIAFDLTVQGATPTHQADGAIRFADASGQTVFILPPAFLVDAAGASSDAVTVSLKEQSPSTFRLELTPDLSWLQDPARVYPVVLDPTVDTWSGTIKPDGTAGDSITVDQGDCCNYTLNVSLFVSKSSTGQRKDTLVKFPELNVIPADGVVTRATMRLFATATPTASPINVYRLTSFWFGQPTWASVTSDPTLVTSVTPVSGWNSVDLTTLARGWVHEEYDNDGVRLVDGGGNNTSAQFASGRAFITANHPELQVTYVKASRAGISRLWTDQNHDTDQAADSHAAPTISSLIGHNYGGGTTSNVNLSTGNLIIQHQDGTIPALGFNVDLTHTYNSQDPFRRADSTGADYGEGWSFSQSMRLSELDGGNAVVFRDGTGNSLHVFAKAQDSGTTRSYDHPLYFDYTLTKDLASPPADASKVYTLKAVVGGDVRSFDAAGKLTRVEDRNGNALTYGYDGSNRLTTITDTGSRTTTLEYNDPSGRLSKLTDMAGRVSTYAYDSAGNLTTIKHAVGTTDETTTSFGYGDLNQLTSVTDPRGHTSRISYQAAESWELASTDGWVGIKNSSGALSSGLRAHDGSRSLSVSLSSASASSPDGAQAVFTSGHSYNSVPQELLIWIYVPSGAPQLNARISLTDINGLVADGPATTLTAGAWTPVRVTFAPVSSVQTISVPVWATSSSWSGTVWFDQLAVRGQVDSQTDAKPTPNKILVYSYDFDHASTQAEWPDQSGTFTSLTEAYNRLGQPTQVTGPNLYIQHTYDTYQREIQSKYWSSTYDQTDYEYYPSTNLLRTLTNAVGETIRWGYNTATGDKRYEINPLNETRRANGQTFVATISVRDSAGNVTSQETNQYAANTDLEQDPFPTPLATLQRLQFSYGTGGVVSSMTDANGNTTTFNYQTGTGYRTEIDAPAGTGEATSRITTITPNSDGTPQQTVDPKSQATTFDYDHLGRLTATHYGVVGGVPIFSVSLALDANGNQTAMTDASGLSSWSYDENNRITSESRTQNGVTKTASYSYFTNGWLSTITTFAGQTVSFGYDGAGRVTSQTDPKDGGRSFTITYDGGGRVSAIAYPSGTQQTYTYDDVINRINEISVVTSGNTTLQRVTYDYGVDDQGVRSSSYHNSQLVSVTELDGSVVTYGYDDLDRLTSAVRTGTNPFNQSYGYDANNNRTSVTVGGVTTTSTYDAANQLITQGSTTFSYDRNGNVVSDGTNSLSYDAANHWTSGTFNGQSLSFGYDGQGRRVYRTVAGSRTDQWYDQTGLTLETGADNATFLRSPNGHLLSAYSGGTLYDYAWDRKGSITGLLSTSGTLTGSYSYDPWGQALGTPPTVYNPFRYTGGYFDSTTALYQMGARYYLPGNGRFTQLDPLPKNLLTIDRYVYAGADPANRVDPTGLDWLTEGIWIVGAALIIVGTGGVAVGLVGVFVGAEVGLDLVAIGGGMLLLGNEAIDIGDQPEPAFDDGTPWCDYPCDDLPSGDYGEDY